MSKLVESPLLSGKGGIRLVLILRRSPLLGLLDNNHYYTTTLCLVLLCDCIRVTKARLIMAAEAQRGRGQGYMAEAEKVRMVTTRGEAEYCSVLTFGPTVPKRFIQALLWVV